MSQGGVLEVGMDLLDDRVPAVDFVGGDGIEVGGSVVEFAEGTLSLWLLRFSRFRCKIERDYNEDR